MLDIDEEVLKMNIELTDIPDIDLYMDQVIQLFEGKLERYKRDEDDKIMTKTMINNYVKGKLLMPVKKKKYTKEHIILIAFIYQLKSILSIADIKILLEGISNKIENEEKVNIDDLYKRYLKLNEDNSKDFKSEIEAIENKVNQLNLVSADEEKLILATTLINKANMYKKIVEKILDDTKEK